jgi:hypothetical protein
MPSNYSRCFKAGPPGLTQAHQQLSRVTTDDEYLLTTSDVAPPVGVRAEAFRIRVSRHRRPPPPKLRSETFQSGRHNETNRR